MFESKLQSMIYYNTIKDNHDVFKELEANEYRQFVISVDNFATLFKDQNVVKYIQFFTKNYLDNK